MCNLFWLVIFFLGSLLFNNIRENKIISYSCVAFKEKYTCCLAQVTEAISRRCKCWMSSGKDWCASSLPRTFILYREICHTLFGYCSTSLTLFCLTLLFESYCYFSIPLHSLLSIKKESKGCFLCFSHIGLMVLLMFVQATQWVMWLLSQLPSSHIFFYIFNLGPISEQNPCPPGQRMSMLATMLPQAALLSQHCHDGRLLFLLFQHSLFCSCQILLFVNYFSNLFPSVKLLSVSHFNILLFASVKLCQKVSYMS